MSEAERATESASAGPRASLVRVIVATLITTATVTVASYAAPDAYAATAVGMTFLAATYVLVLRFDAPFIRVHGLSLGGMFEPEPLSPLRLLRAGAVAVGVAFAVLAVVAVPFAIGFRLFYARVYHVDHAFDVMAALRIVPKEALGQLVVIALPEEAFFRGFLQSQIDALLSAKRRFLGADVSFAIPIAALVFALGHVLTRPDPGRLAVFFPALLFGFLRVRTKGIGASVVLHALSNLLSSALAAGYKLHP